MISSVTDAVIEEVKTWQNRPLDALYPILYLDALQVKVRDGAHIRNKAIYLAIGINLAGLKEVLGLWVAQTEGAKFYERAVKSKSYASPATLRCRSAASPQLCRNHSTLRSDFVSAVRCMKCSRVLLIAGPGSVLLPTIVLSETPALLTAGPTATSG